MRGGTFKGTAMCAGLLREHLLGSPYVHNNNSLIIFYWTQNEEPLFVCIKKNYTKQIHIFILIQIIFIELQVCICTCNFIELW